MGAPHIVCPNSHDFLQKKQQDFSDCVEPVDEELPDAGQSGKSRPDGSLDHYRGLYALEMIDMIEVS